MGLLGGSLYLTGSVAQLNGRYSGTSVLLVAAGALLFIVAGLVQMAPITTIKSN